jgi:hypothetical protein
MDFRLDRRSFLAGALAFTAPASQTLAQPASDGPGAGILRDAIESRRRWAGALTGRGGFGLVDFSIPSYYPRFFILSADGGTLLKSYYVSHGRGSDPGTVASPIPSSFSNAPKSKASCIGAFVTLDQYVGEHGESLRLRGLEATNDNAEKRYIVIHTAPYVSEARARATIPMGRSFGCFVVPKPDLAEAIETLGTGSFLYAAKGAST